MKRTVTTLSDGRELIYFDPDDRADRSVLDQRALHRVESRPELRYDRALDEWVIVAAHRQSRTFQPAAADCPLCPSQPGRPTEIPAGAYEVVVFENRFAALGAPEDPAAPGDAQRRPGVGRCEVVCFSDRHDASFAQLSPERVELVVEAWVDRTQELATLPGVEQVFCFENRGKDIGVTLEHPHGQIYAYPFVTPRTRRMLSAARRHEQRTGRNLADDTLAAELDEEVRVIHRGEHWTAFVPFAARWPYEVHLYPNRRVPDLAALPGPARTEFALAYTDVLSRFDALFGVPAPYISAVHQAPRVARDVLGLHIEIFTSRRDTTKLKYLAGSEAAMEAFANDVAPEAAAERLRASTPRR
ncbi:MAG TPA: galactose-1-phosphate uridylyltransferase [Jatrophihabitans sp.]